MKKLVVLFNIVFAVLGLLAIPVVLMSFMIFDAQGSENNNYAWLLFWSILTFPVTSLISVALSTAVLIIRKNELHALFPFILPISNVLACIVAVILIEMYCGGGFAC